MHYTEEERVSAIVFYLENGVSLRRTVGRLGYPSREQLRQWLGKDGVQVGFADGPALQSSLVRRACMQARRTVAGKEPVGPMEDRGKEPGGGEPPGSELERLRAEKRELDQEKYRLGIELAVARETIEIIKKDRGVDSGPLSNKEKTALVGALANAFPLKDLLAAAGLCRSTYYYRRAAGARTDGRGALRADIRRIFSGSGGAYGYRRVWRVLRDEGKRVSEKVVRRLMGEDGLVACGTGAEKRWSSYAGEPGKAPGNLVGRDFHADAPNELWLTDISEFKAEDGKACLSPMLDCFDGMAVAYSIGTDPGSSLTDAMLDEALSSLGPGDAPVVHSDRGGHYFASGWVSKMEGRGLARSMSAKGCPPDNAACEGFFGRMKNEMYHGRGWHGRPLEDLIAAMHGYMHWYNEHRTKMSLEGMSPRQYRKSLGLAA